MAPTAIGAGKPAPSSLLTNYFPATNAPSSRDIRTGRRNKITGKHDAPPPRSESEAKVRRPDDRKRSKGSRRRKGKMPLPPPQAVCPPSKPRSPSDLDVEDDGAPKKKKTRTNLVGDEAEKMRNAVAEWDALPTLPTGHKRVHPQLGKISRNEFARSKNIKEKQFEKYAHYDPAKRRVISNGVGRRPVIPNDTSDFMADVIVRADRGNQGKTPQEAQADFQNLLPDLKPKQVQNHFNRTFKKRHADKIKPKAVKAQKTTGNRSQCNAAQQYRWHTRTDRAFRFLREKNTGVCRKTGRQFEAVMKHFISGGDESNFLADADGNLKVLAEKGRPKHEKRAGDFRGSLTALRYGFAGGANGPTAFVLAGKRKRAGYSDKWLKEHGCAHGSTIAMNENAFMTTKTWEEITPSIVSGLRSAPYVKENPQWWVLEIFDGFGAHLNSHYALKYRWDHKVISLKEEPDSSSICQAYDKYAAKSDKSVQRINLALLRKIFNEGTIDIIDQWKLLHCAIAAVQFTDKHPKIWINSFIAVNLHPEYRVSFEDWCKRIEPFMQASDNFDLITQNSSIDLYTLLPAFWHGMTPAEKTSVVSVVDRFGEEAWSVACIKTLHEECSIPYNDMGSLQACVHLAQENPSHLQRGLPDDDTQAEVPVAAAGDNDSSDVVAKVEASRKKANHGLRTFQLKPQDLSGTALLDHMIQFRRREYGSKEEEHVICEALDVEIRTKHQRDLMALNYHERIQEQIMGRVGEGTSLDKAAKVRLCNLGLVANHSAFVKNPERLSRLESQLRLQQSIGSIHEIQQQANEASRKKEDAELLAHLHEALPMWRSGARGGNKFKKNHIKAMLVFIFGITPPKSGPGSRKEQWKASLQAADQKEPARIQNYTLPPLPIILPQAPAPAPAQSSSSPPPLPNNNAIWLYTSLDDARQRDGFGPVEKVPQTLLLAEAVLKGVQDIKARGYQDGSTYLNYFSDVLKVPKMDKDFMMELCNKLEDLVKDDNLTMEELTKLAP